MITKEQSNADYTVFKLSSLSDTVAKKLKKIDKCIFLDVFDREKGLISIGGVDCNHCKRSKNAIISILKILSLYPL